MQTTTTKNLTLRIKPSSITVALLSIVLLLAAAHTLVHLISYTFDVPSENMFGLKHFFDMGTESNLPTYISALILLLTGGLLTCIAHFESNNQRKPAWHWWGLAICLVYMSFDEATMIHEGLIGANLTKHFGRGEGIWYYTWYKMYIPVVIFISVLYLPFMLRLPRRYSLRLLLAAVIFLSGSIGFEMLESYVESHRMRGRDLVRLFEETSEMLGVVLAIHTLLLYLAEYKTSFLLEFKETDEFYDESPERQVQSNIAI